MKIEAAQRLLAAQKPFKVLKGMKLYHSTSVKFSLFKDRPTWFTPTPEQAQGYHDNIGKGAKTLECEWLGGKVASPSDAMPYVHKIWPDFEDDEPMYSMFDIEIGEWDKDEVKAFISLLIRAGYSGAVHPDYSSINSDDDSYTLVVFNPQKSIKILNVKE